MKGFKTINEAAEMMKLSTGHIRQLCIDGKLIGAHKMGNQWIIPDKAIIDYKPGPKGFGVVWAKRRLKNADLLANALAQNAATRTTEAVS